MRLGVHLGYWGARPSDPVPLALEAERLGFDSVWTAEAWGSDAVTILSWIGARTQRIGLGTAAMQIPARTPATTAMTAITLDHLSGGRFRLGLGSSGPQIALGWHGVDNGRPLERTREYVEIVRSIVRREAPLEFHGRHYDIPLGDAKPMRTIVHPLRAELPVYLAALGPRNIALAAEIADGWLPLLLSPEHVEVFRPHLDVGFARTARDTAGFDVAPIVKVALGDDVETCRDAVRAFLALYIGGMGPRDANFYNRLVSRYGYEEEAARIQEAYLGGRKREAEAGLSDALIDELTLVGPRERVADRLAAWGEAGATTLIVVTDSVDAIRTLAEVAI